MAFPAMIGTLAKMFRRSGEFEAFISAADCAAKGECLTFVVLARRGGITMQMKSAAGRCRRTPPPKGRLDGPPVKNKDCTSRPLPHGKGLRGPTYRSPPDASNVSPV